MTDEIEIDEEELKRFSEPALEAMLKMNHQVQKEEIEEDVYKLFEFCGYEKPEILIYDNFTEAQYMCNVLASKNLVRDHKDELIDEVMNEEGDDYRKKAKNEHPKLRTSDSIERKAREIVSKEIDDFMVDFKPVNKYYFGTAWACMFNNSWFIPYVDFRIMKGDKTIPEIYHSYKKVSLSCAFMTIIPGYCIMTRLPKYIALDENKRLHSTTKPAIYDQHYIHGIFFKEELWNKVLSPDVKPEELLSIESVDQRFVAIEHYGFEKLWEKLDKKLLDKSKYGNELWEVQWGNVRLHAIRYPDIDDHSKSRISFVDASLKTAGDAMAWKHNCSEEQYLKAKVLNQCFR